MYRNARLASRRRAPGSKLRRRQTRFQTANFEDKSYDDIPVRSRKRDVRAMLSGRRCVGFGKAIARKIMFQSLENVRLGVYAVSRQAKRSSNY